VKIKRLEIRGFKSFLEKTIVHFPAGISAVVGPNGCGKSNIVDAIRWALGEQSPSRLRGRQMEDVIFGGSNGRKPFGLAEVSLVFSNDNGNAPERYRDFTEIMITRRLFRSGNSEYLLNKQACRLKDVQEVFWDTGLGSRSYSVIEQGHVSAVVDMKPDERRTLIEEAAGISKYRNRKREALQKMEASQQNLIRIQDLMGEVGRQLNALKRQASKARRYREFQGQLRSIELQRAYLLFHDIETMHHALQKEYDTTRDGAMDLESRTSALKSRYDVVKLRFSEQEAAIRTQDRLLHDVKEQINRHRYDAERTAQRLSDLAKMEEDCHSELALHETRRFRLEDEIRERVRELEQLMKDHGEQKRILTELEDELCCKAGDVAKLSSSLETEKTGLLRLIAAESEFGNKIKRFEDLNRELERRKAGIGRELEQLSHEQDSVERSISEILADLEVQEEECARSEEERSLARQAVDSLNRLRDEMEKRTRKIERETHAAQSRLNAMKELWQKREYFDEGVRNLLEKIQEAGICTDDASLLLADVVRAAPEYEVAVEAALGPKLQALIVPDGSGVLRILRSLSHEIEGRIRLLTREPRIRDTQPHTDKISHPWLHHHVQVPEPYEELLKRLLEDICVVSDLSEACVFFQETGLPVVTLSGDQVERDGIWTVGSGREVHSKILSRKREIEELEHQTALLERELLGSQDKLDALRKDRTDAQDRLELAEEDLERAKSRLAESEHTSVRLQDKRDTLDQRCSIVQEDMRRLAEESCRLQERIQNVAQDLTQATSSRSRQEAVLRESSLQHAALSKAIESLKEHVYQKRLVTQSGEEKIRLIESEVSRTRQLTDDMESRAETLKRRLEECLSEQEGLFEKDKDLSQRISSLALRLEEEHTALTRLQDSQESTEHTLSELDQEIRHLDKENRRLHDQLGELQVKITEKRMELRHILEDTWTKYGVRLDQEKPEVAETADLEGLRRAAQELAERIRHLGEINPSAIEEHDTMAQRFEFLETQKSDVAQSIEEIHKAVRRINQVCRTKLIETLDQINENLKEVFPALFGGGKAELRLTNPADVLESGIEMDVQPPGKTVTVMGLLSGGEKALSALALLFSMYLIKPSPFYLLDEIDAPLDEANVDRFNRLLKDMASNSQIILVTHNRRTMEVVDQLYGVTMEQPGISKLVTVNLKEVAAE